MKSHLRFLQVILFLSISGLLANETLAVPAFPGAEGGGANSTGGRGGYIYEVTNLNDSGAGSLRYGLENLSGTRTIVFKIGGIIQLESGILVQDQSGITIAGQTAPGDGITLGGENMTEGLLLFIGAHDITIRYLRLRKGGNPESQVGDNIVFLDNCYNCIVDHCSMSWGADQNLSIWSEDDPAYNITIQWCIISEGMMDHSCGFLAGSNTDAENMTDISIHHNLFAQNNNRNPLLKVKSADIINNIIYNWGWWSTGIGGGITVDIIGNVYKDGSDSGTRREILYKPYDGTHQATGPSGTPTIYFASNIGPNNNDPEEDAWSLMMEMTAVDSWGCPLVGGVPTMTDIPSGYESATRRSTSQSAITIDSAEDLDFLLLKTWGVGASGKLDRYGNWTENRDKVDAGVISDYFAGTGGLIDPEPTFPDLVGGVAYTDSDHDGMPDAWENMYGLNPVDPSDRNRDSNNNGYTNLEEFLNGTDPQEVIRFSLNESSGTTASASSGNFTATLCNGLNFTNNSVTGIAGTALELDGSDDLMYLSPCPSYSGDFTWAAWIKFSNTQQGNAGIISTSPSGGNVRVRMDIDSDGKLCYGLYDNSWAQKTGVGSDLSDGEWHHVAVTFDRNGYAKGYVDGVLKDDSLSIADKTGTVVGTHYIGYDSYGCHFDGAIDEVKEYNDVLTQKQIATLAKNVPVSFSLDESSGTTALDAFGNFTATLSGGISFNNDSVAGIVGTALELDGSNDLMYLSPCPSYSGDFTWAAWIKFSDPHQGVGIISTSPSDGNIRARIAIGSDGKLRYGLYDSSWAEKTGVGEDLSDGVWHHVAVTFDRDGYAKGYVDGILKDDTLSIATKIGIVVGTHYIGYDSYLTSHYFDGTMDEVREYNRVLTADEIDVLANNSPMCFSFNENSGTTASDSSGNFTATLYGGLSFANDSVAGMIVTALEFDGSNDYVGVSPSPSYSGDFTCSVWIKFSTQQEGGIISTSPSGSNVRMRIAVGSDGKLRYGLYYGSWTEKAGVGNDMSDGEWHHVAVTFDRDGYARAYVDGVLKDDSLYIAAQTGMVGGAHYIGYDGWMATPYFNGAIDEVREYNRVLTTDEIDALAKGNPIIFSLDENYGTTTYDSSGNFTASLSGGLNFTYDSVAGVVGTALEFDGSNDYMHLSPCPSYSGDFTWAAWIKFSDAYQGVGIISTSPSDGNIRARIAIGSDGKLCYGLYDNSWAQKTGVGSDLSDGEWHHVAVTFDRNGYAKGYVDGVLKDDSLSIADKTGTVVGTHCIGYGSWMASHYFDGTIDEVRECNRVLTASEINFLANP